MKRWREFGFIELIIFVSLLKFAISPDWISVGALLVGVLALMHQSYEENKKKIIEERIVALRDFNEMKIGLLEKQIGEILETLNHFKGTQAQLEKSAEDIKKVISTKNLTQSLAPYQRTRT